MRAEGQAVGTVGAIVDGAPKLVWLWVDPAWRGQGVGDLLVQAQPPSRREVGMIRTL